MPLGLLIILIVAAAFAIWILGMAPLDAQLMLILRGLIIFIVVILVLVWALNFLGIDTGRVGKNVYRHTTDQDRPLAAFVVGRDALLNT